MAHCVKLTYIVGNTAMKFPFHRILEVRTPSLSATLVVTAILMLTLWFCTPAGFLGGLIPGVVLAAAGVLLLREKKGGGH